MFKNYLKIAWRNLLKNKVSTSVNLVCLAVGLTCCMLIAIYIRDELSFNRFNSNYNNIYRIDWTSNRTGEIVRSAITPISLAHAVETEVPQVKKVVRLYQRSGGMEMQNELKGANEKKFQEQGVYFSDNNLFSVFTISFIKGESATALKAPNSVVITDEMAK